MLDNQNTYIYSKNRIFSILKDRYLNSIWKNIQNTYYKRSNLNLLSLALPFFEKYLINTSNLIDFVQIMITLRVKRRKNVLEDV